MVTDQFGAILQELGKSLTITDLHADANNSCMLKLVNGLIIQLEPEKMGHYLVVGCDLGLIPPGKYRENIFREALKANGMPPPQFGIFAFSRKTDHLILYDRLPMKDLNGEKVAQYLVLFNEKALLWKNALANNEIPSVVPVRTSGIPPGGLFGLR